MVAMKQPEIENSSIKDPAGHIDHQQDVGLEGTSFPCRQSFVGKRVPVLIRMYTKKSKGKTVFFQTYCSSEVVTEICQYSPYHNLESMIQVMKSITTVSGKRASAVIANFCC